MQYAKIFGGTVATIEVTDEKLQLAKDLGADITIDARTEDPATVLQSHGGADVAIGLAVDSKSFAAAYTAAGGSCWSRCPQPGHSASRFSTPCSTDLGDRIDRRHPRRPAGRVRPARRRADPGHL